MKDDSAEYLDQGKLLAYEKVKVRVKMKDYLIDKLLSTLALCLTSVFFIILSAVLNKSLEGEYLLVLLCVFLLYLNILSIASICKLQDRLNALQDVIEFREKEYAKSK